MCAIGGILKLDKRKTFDLETQLDAISLLMEMEDRGSHSWGVYLEKRKGNYHLNCGIDDDTVNGELFKLPGRVSEFFDDNEGKIYLDDVHTMLMHTRQATHGSSDLNRNNHPFNTKDFLLSHNGIISNADELKKKYKLKYKSECDSYLIVSLIQHKYDECGEVVRAIVDSLNEIEGGFACWLYHKPKKDLYVFRNNRNPFEYYIDEDKGVFIFASEDDYIIDATNKGLLKTDVKTLPINTIFKLHGSTLDEVATFSTPTTTTSTGWNNTCNARTTGTPDISKFDTIMGEFYRYLHTYDDTSFNSMLFTIRDNAFLYINEQNLESVLDLNGFNKHKKEEFSGVWTRYCMTKDEMYNLLKSFFKEAEKKEEPKKYNANPLLLVQDLTDLTNDSNMNFSYINGTYTFKITKDTPLPIIKLFKKHGFDFKKRSKTLILKDVDYHNKKLIELIEEYLEDD